MSLSAELRLINVLIIQALSQEQVSGRRHKTTGTMDTDVTQATNQQQPALHERAN